MAKPSRGTLKSVLIIFLQCLGMCVIGCVFAALTLLPQNIIIIISIISLLLYIWKGDIWLRNRPRSTAQVSIGQPKKFANTPDYILTRSIGIGKKAYYHRSKSA